MTTDTITETPEPVESPEPAEVSESAEPQSGGDDWGRIAVNCANRMTRANFERGDLAALRRMESDSHRPAIFWRLLAENGLLEYGSDVESKWALILHGIALMTQANAGDGQSRNAHDGSMPVGRALSLIDYSEQRFNRLLTARETMLRTLLARMFRMLAAKDMTFNWREMARFILNDGYHEEAADQFRHNMARHYYRAERQSREAETEAN